MSKQLYAVRHSDPEMGWANERYPFDKPCHVPQLFEDVEVARLFISNNGLLTGPKGYNIVPVCLPLLADVQAEITARDHQELNCQVPVG